MNTATPAATDVNTDPAYVAEAARLLYGDGGPDGTPERNDAPPPPRHLWNLPVFGTFWADVSDVWSSAVAPGGKVCRACAGPTESEPCPEHQPTAYLAAVTDTLPPGSVIAVDADCPACGYPERTYNPTTQRFGCPKCLHTSQERTA